MSASDKRDNGMPDSNVAWLQSNLPAQSLARALLGVWNPQESSDKRSERLLQMLKSHKPGQAENDVHTTDKD